jgi:hypothetical protein
MTDYASQGCTQPNNPVDLSSCRDHRSYYTCLSRSASADGTIIIQGFDPLKITGGTNGYLRQEFRELELLDDITKMHYESSLPENIEGIQRNDLLRQYQEFRGQMYVPEHIHKAIRWSKNDPMKLIHETKDTAWKLISKQKNIGQALSKRKKEFDSDQQYKKMKTLDSSNNGNEHGTKRKSEFTEPVCTKKQKTTSQSEIDYSYTVGLKWDHKDYSCAYDALFTIFYQIWIHNPTEWNHTFKKINPIMRLLSSQFHKFHNNEISIECARDTIHEILHEREPEIFPYGYAGTNVVSLAEHVLYSETNETYNKPCIPYILLNIASMTPLTCIQAAMDNHNNQINSDRLQTLMPRILTIPIDYSHPINEKIRCNFDENYFLYRLKGIIYFGDFHFTTRIFNYNGTVWYHDGMENRGKCQYECDQSDISSTDLKKCNTKNACLLIYIIL